MLGKHSQESIDRMKAAKYERWLSSLDWSKVEPFWDITFDKSSRNKASYVLSFRIFKSLVDQRKTVLDMLDMGYPKHLASFMSKFLKGKITLTKEEFEKDYIEKGLSLDEISKKYRIGRENVTYLREMWDIKATGPKYQLRKRTESPITEEQRQIIIGSLLGDAGRMSSSSVKFKHGGPQKEYLLWKYEKLKSIACQKSLKLQPYVTDTGNEGLSCIFYTRANSDVEQILRMFYPDGKKIVTKEILNNLSPLAIAVWFMDDGKTDFKIHSSYCASPESTICTDSFSVEMCQMICDWFDERFGIKCMLTKSSKGSPRVRIRAQSSYAFLSMLWDYVLPCLEYKVKYEASKKRIEKKRTLERSVICRNRIINDVPTGESFIELDLNKRDEWVQEVVKAYQQAGFDSILPNPKFCKIDLYKAINFSYGSLLLPDCIAFSKIGHKFCSGHFPSIWKTRSKGRQSPEDVFSETRYMCEIVTDILMRGSRPTCSAIRRGIRSYRGSKAISSFMPLIASAIFEKYATENSSVLDFCGGFGGRMMGAWMSPKVKSIYVLEPELETFKGLISLRHSLRKTGTYKETDIKNVDFMHMKTLQDATFDFCLTSVPYFDAEEYSKNACQSYVQYGTYGQWFEKFLLDAIREASRVCKVVAINVNNTGPYKIADDLRDWLKKEKILRQEDRIRYSKYGGGFKYEPLFIIQAGAPAGPFE